MQGVAGIPTTTTIAPAAPACPIPAGKEVKTDVPAPKGVKRARGTKNSAPDMDPVLEGGEEKQLESGTWLIVAKAVRMHLKNNEVSMHCGADALPALNAKLAEFIKDAIVRASANGRKTLKACDF